ncbi:hypothetical protein T484DRAFT_2026215 [Baffinella frigidus]|nr:hypothetical protein T484DRAFT_2026215 [Cryptophyta sp. CCMP2293]
MLAMHEQSLPKLAQRRSVSPVAKRAPKQLPFLGMRLNPSPAAKKVVQLHSKTSFLREPPCAASDAWEMVKDELRKQLDPRGHLKDVLEREPIIRNHADGDFVRCDNPGVAEQSLGPPNPPLRGSEIRDSSTDDTEQFLWRSSSLRPLELHAGPVEEPPVSGSSFTRGDSYRRLWTKGRRSTGSEIRKQLDPRGHLKEVLDQRESINRNHADGDSVRCYSPGVAQQSLGPATSPLRVSAIRDSSTDDNTQSFRRGFTLRPSELHAGPVEEPPRGRHEENDSPLASPGHHHASPLASPGPRHGSPLPSPGSHAVRRFPTAARPVVPVDHPTLTHSSSDVGARGAARESAKSRIRIMWQPESNVAFKHDFGLEDAPSPSPVFSPGPASPHGRNGRYWNLKSH